MAYIINILVKYHFYKTKQKSLIEYFFWITALCAWCTCSSTIGRLLEGVFNSGRIWVGIVPLWHVTWCVQNVSCSPNSIQSFQGCQENWEQWRHDYRRTFEVWKKRCLGHEMGRCKLFFYFPSWVASETTLFLVPA